MGGFARTFGQFFKRPDIGVVLAFLLLYRFAEAQLVKMVAPFLLDPREAGGLGLSTTEVGIAYGTVGVGALLLGGILGGIAISRKGLRWWLWPMVIIMHSPDLMFVYLSHVQPTDFRLITAAVAIGQFGYGFGFTAYMMYMIMISEGQYKTAHYAICTAIMAFGMMITGAWTGALKEWIGYRSFFLWVLVREVEARREEVLARVASALDERHDYADAAAGVRELHFIDRFRDELAAFLDRDAATVPHEH